MKKKVIKKLTAAAMVAAMAVGMLNMGVRANAESVSAATQDEADGVMPMYEKMAVVSWTDCEERTNLEKKYTVQSVPVKIVCYNCLKGAAKVTIKVNGLKTAEITIPKNANQELTKIINCKKGNEISFTVEPATGYAVTTGDLMLYY